MNEQNPTLPCAQGPLITDVKLVIYDINFISCILWEIFFEG